MALYQNCSSKYEPYLKQEYESISMTNEDGYEVMNPCPQSLLPQQRPKVERDQASRINGCFKFLVIFLLGLLAGIAVGIASGVYIVRFEGERTHGANNAINAKDDDFMENRIPPVNGDTDIKFDTVMKNQELDLRFASTSYLATTKEVNESTIFPSIFNGETMKQISFTEKTTEVLRINSNSDISTPLPSTQFRNSSVASFATLSEPTTEQETAFKALKTVQNEVNRNCYFVYIRGLNTMTYQMAHDFCQKQDSVVATIPNESVYKLIISHLRSNRRHNLRASTAWIGTTIDPTMGKQGIVTRSVPDSPPPSVSPVSPVANIFFNADLDLSLSC